MNFKKRNLITLGNDLNKIKMSVSELDLSSNPPMRPEVYLINCDEIATLFFFIPFLFFNQLLV